MYKTGERVNSYRDSWSRKREQLDESEQYTLTKNQARFVNDAIRSELEIDWTYSGRGMYGKLCPAVVVEQANELRTKAVVREDSMGRDVVIYAQN